VNTILPRSVVELLTQVRRGLWLARGSRTVRLAGCVACALALAAGLWHVTTAALTFQALLGLPALAIAVSLVVALIRRPALRDCAAWADRNLEGCTAFTTLLALARGPGSRATPAASAHLRAWTERAAARGLRRYAERPAAHVVPQCVLLIALAATFGTVFLALPGHEAHGGVANETGLAVPTLADLEVSNPVAAATPGSRLRSVAAASPRVGLPRERADSDIRSGASLGQRPPSEEDATSLDSQPEAGAGLSHDSAGAGGATNRQPGIAPRADSDSRPAAPRARNALEGAAIGIERSDDPRARRAARDTSGGYSPFVTGKSAPPLSHIDVAPAIHTAEPRHAYTVAERRLVERYLAAIGAQR